MHFKFLIKKYLIIPNSSKFFLVLWFLFDLQFFQVSQDLVEIKKKKLFQSFVWWQHSVSMLWTRHCAKCNEHSAVGDKNCLCP